MFIMYDSVDLTQVPNNPHAVGCYRNGRFANEAEARKRFPHAYIVPISVTGIVPCMAYDIERGDYTPDQAPSLFSVAHAHGIWRPILYASLDTWPAVTDALTKAGIVRREYRKWSAHYDGKVTFDGDEDAKQFDDHALNRNLDESICATGFFPPTQPVQPQPSSAEERAEWNQGFQSGFQAGWKARQ